MERYDIVIMGGGPGGYTAAIRAAQLGMRAAVVERERVGGLCLNWGCIPSKALIYNAKLVEAFRRGEDYGMFADNIRFDLGIAIDRSRDVVEKMVGGIEFLLERNKADVIRGDAKLVAPGRVRAGGSEIEAANVIVATGARPRQVPGLEVDGDVIIGSTEALLLKQLPRSIAIVGGGAIGMEFAYIYSAYGAEVTVIEMLPHLLPQEDDEISKQLERAMKKRGVKALTNARVEAVERAEGGVALSVTRDGKSETVRAEKVLVAAGMEGATEGLGLMEAGVAIERGFVTVDPYGATNVASIYAAGDITGPPLLAHVAQAQGVAAVERIAGIDAPVPPAADMPRATYCEPQVASIGLTEAQARERGYTVKIGKFPLSGNGKALAEGQTDGMAKLVVDAEYDEVLGLHIIGESATELLGEATMARALESTSRALGAAVHAHPTIAEVIKEAALAVHGEAIHFWQGKGGG